MKKSYIISIAIGAVIVIALAIGYRSRFFGSTPSVQPNNNVAATDSSSQNSAPQTASATIPSDVATPAPTTSPTIQPTKPASTTPKPTAATSPVLNPFQDYYDYLPQGGEIQTCIKTSLGTNFTPVYNGVAMSKATATTVQNAVNICNQNIKSFKDAYDTSPIGIQQCYKLAFGADLEKDLADPSFNPTPPQITQISSCPAFIEGTAKYNAAQKYFTSVN